MNCHDSQDWLQRRLDGEMLPMPDGLEQHLAGCTMCRQQQHTVPLLLEVLQGLKPPAAPEGLTEAIVARVVADRRARSLRWRRSVGTTAALAASLLISALAGYFWFPASKTDNHQNVEAKKQPSPQQTPNVIAAAPSLTRSVEEARSAVASLTEKIADKSKEQARLWLDVSGTLPTVKLEQPLAAQSLRQTGQGMSDGLQTVAESARRAVSYFVRELPPLERPRSGS